VYFERDDIYFRESRSLEETEEAGSSWVGERCDLNRLIRQTSEEKKTHSPEA